MASIFGSSMGAKKSIVPAFARERRAFVIGSTGPTKRKRWAKQIAQIATPLESIPSNLTKFEHHAPLEQLIAFEGRLKHRLRVRQDDKIELYKRSDKKQAAYFAVVKSGRFAGEGKAFQIINTNILKALKYLETGKK